jgi:hypothetical protein
MTTQNTSYGFALATMLAVTALAMFVALYHALGHTQLY